MSTWPQGDTAPQPRRMFFLWSDCWYIRTRTQPCQPRHALSECKSLFSTLIFTNESQLAHNCESTASQNIRNFSTIFFFFHSTYFTSCPSPFVLLFVIPPPGVVTVYPSWNYVVGFNDSGSEEFLSTHRFAWKIKRKKSGVKT